MKVEKEPLASAKEPLIKKSSEANHEVRKLYIAASLSLTIMLIEIVGGLLANSLAIVTDAMHMLSDVAGFIVSIATIYIMNRKATPQYSYGFQQAGALGALCSALSIWLLAGILLVQSIYRFVDPQPINGKLMTGIATFGLGANALMMAVLGHDHSHGGGGCSGHGHSHGGVSDHGHSHGGSGHAHDGCCDGHGHGDGDAKLAHEHGHAYGHEDGNSHGHDVSHNGHAHGEEHGHGDAKCCDVDHGHGQLDVEHGHGHSEHGAAHGGGHADVHGHDHGKDETGHSHKASSSLAMQAALIHVIGDFVQSLGVVISGLFIWWQPFDLGVTSAGLTKWVYLDPICTFLFSLLVIYTTVGTVNQALAQVLMRCPDSIDLGAFRKSLIHLDHVLSIHDLHVWQVGQGIMCSVHVVIDESANCSSVLRNCIEVAQEKHGIGHSTFQLEVKGEFDHQFETLQLGLTASCHEVLCNPNECCS